DPARAAPALAIVARQVGDGVALPPSHDPAARQMRRLLSCVPLVSAAPEGADSLLASRCNRP
ncbi:MAG TPA: hypothetical protein VFX39_09370, partial [Gemmatimonadaceae bacterium]|nr:hypothetical protein [Gemmatimonadaceae bacterium]